MKYQILTESGLSRVYQYTTGKNFGIITAFRKENTLETNREQNELLRRDIHFEGFGVVKVKGRYIENYGRKDQKEPSDEEGFMIMSEPNDSGRLKHFLMKMGEKYNQDSIFYKQFGEDAILIGTKRGTYPGYHKQDSLGKFHPNQIGEFFTILRGGKTFTFESIDFTLEKSFSKRAEHVIASYSFRTILENLKEGM